MKNEGRSHNLADKTPEERAALELDKARWFIARHWLTKFDRLQILNALENCHNDEEREDMRRRLNVMRKQPEYAAMLRARADARAQARQQRPNSTA